MYKVEKKTIDFLETAPFQLKKSFELNMTSFDFWNLLIDTKNWKTWFPNFKSATNLVENEGGLGSKRQVEFGNLVAVEQFIAWDEQKKWAFSVVQMNVPILKGMVEQVLIKEKNNKQIQIEWRVAAMLKWWAKPLQSFLEKDMHKNFDKMILNLKKKETQE